MEHLRMRPQSVPNAVGNGRAETGGRRLNLQRGGEKRSELRPVKAGS